MFKIFALFLYVIHRHFVSCENAKPLFLTPFIENGKIEEARKAAEVKPFLPNVNSYSGYLTVNKEYNSNLFFWFFTANANWTTSPLVLWLQGGPGASSMFGLFGENGPYVFKKGKLERRYYSWTNFSNVIYIDNPVGTGFSFTDSEKGYATDQKMVGENLHEALRQFLILFPEMQEVKIILSGESYAGKYVPSLAHTILKKNITSPTINIYGLFVGNPATVPEHMLPHYNEYLYAHGLLDDSGREKMRKREEQILRYMNNMRWAEAADLFAKTFFEDHINQTSLFQELTGIPNHFNLAKDKSALNRFYEKFLNDTSTMNALHVRHDAFGKNNWSVYLHLKSDLMKSMKSHFEEVLENYRVLIYAGQFDIICPFYLQECVHRKLNWNGSWDYYKADRKPFRWNQYLCGYYKTAKKFTEVMVRNAGHMVPADKPQWILGLLRKFSKGDFDLHPDSININF